MNVMDAIRIRRSVRKYRHDAIADEVMARMKDALRLAPSACNFQPWRFIFVTENALRERVAAACNGQSWMAEAPVIVVGVGLPGAAYKQMGGAGNSVDLDIAIALDHLSLAAAAEGLGTCWIGAFKEDEIKSLLAIPATAKIIALMPLGVPATPDLLHPASAARRKTADDIFCCEKFS